jgi:hypothetical protein
MSYRQGVGFSEVEGFKIPCAAITLRAESSFHYRVYLDWRHVRWLKAIDVNHSGFAVLLAHANRKGFEFAVYGIGRTLARMN